MDDRHSSWQRFERLVASVHAAEQQGADVRWNDTIAGRQFDVTVRFEAGVYKYLTVVECKDTRRKVEVKDVEAFVTKSRRAKANKAIMVARSGFQSGCFEEAEISGIELFTLKELDDLPDGVIDLGFIPTLHTYDFRLVGVSETISLPEHRNILPFLIKETRLSWSANTVTLEQLLNTILERLWQKATNEAQEERLPMQRGAVVDLPDVRTGNTLERIELELKELRFSFAIIERRAIRGTGLDPYLFRGSLKYTDEVSGEERVYRPEKLVNPEASVPEVGKFYETPLTGFRYLCHGKDEECVTMTMLEGFQHGRNLQVTFTQTCGNARGYVEITDANEILRLHAILASLERISGPLSPKM